MAYKARREQDQTWTLTGVPIFSFVRKGEKGAPFNIDKQWLDTTLANLRKRHGTGYYPPVHVHHHGTEKPTFLVGQFEAERVAPYDFGTERQPALYVTLKGIPDHAFHAIWEGQYPYVSVEIVRYGDREIDSLALLDDDAPFFRFRLLNRHSIEIEAGSPTPGKEMAGVFSDSDAVQVAVPTGSVNFCAAEVPSMGKFVLCGNPADGFSLHDDKGEAVTTATFSSASSFTFEPDKGYGLVCFEDKEKDDDLPGDMKSLKALAKRVAAKLKKLQNDDGDKDDEQHTPAEPEEKGMKKHDAKDEASLLARFDAMEARLNTMETQRAVSARIDSAVKGLKGDGYHVSETTRKSIAKFAAVGEPELDEFLKHYRASVPKDGPETLDGDAEPVEHESVARFRAAGPEAHTKAEQFSAEFDRLIESGYFSAREDRARFIERRMAAAGFKVAS